MPKRKVKKVEVKITENNEKIKPFITIDGVDLPCLSKEHLLESEVFNHKHATIVEGLRARNLEMQKVELDAKLRIDALRREIIFLTDQSNSLKDQNKRFWNKLGELYGIDFTKVTYDSETGVITFIEDRVKEKEERKLKKKQT
ncbi:MAG: hypothetical protein BV456_03125 [Thermoplasmata archaeon M8B2D]|nr:MAG: hypothetical protein BV456_03125 [Thermoplasmata archaeon M8B2D]